MPTIAVSALSFSVAGCSIVIATGLRCSICFGTRPTREQGAAQRWGIPTYGKTGTTQNNRDALFIGFAGDLVVGVWVGRDDDKSLGKVTGGTAAAQLWRSFMASAVAVDGRRSMDLPFSPRLAPPPERHSQSPLPPNGANPVARFAKSAAPWKNSSRNRSAKKWWLTDHKPPF